MLSGGTGDYLNFPVEEAVGMYSTGVTLSSETLIVHDDDSGESHAVFGGRIFFVEVLKGEMH